MYVCILGIHCLELVICCFFYVYTLEISVCVCARYQCDSILVVSCMYLHT